jgi:pimeloyl-ACP methyl ester carboxylesterase
MEGKRARQRMAGRLLREGMERYAVEVLPKMLAPASIERSPNLALHVLAMMRNTDSVGAAAALRGRAERPSYETTLESLRVPSLIVAGDVDAFTTRADAERMRALLPGSELVWLAGVGHMPNLEAPRAFNAAMRRLLEAVAATEPAVPSTTLNAGVQHA